MATTVTGGGCKPVGGVGKEKTGRAERREIRKKKIGLQDRYDHRVTLRLNFLKGWAGDDTPVWDFVSEFTKSVYSGRDLGI